MLTEPGQGWTNVFYPAKPLNTSAEYRVHFRGDHFDFFLDGVHLGSATVTWTSDEAQLGGESETLASQMPGGNDNHYEWYSLSQIELGLDNWQPFGGILSWPTYGYFGSATTSTYQHRIWDWACPQ